MWKSSTFLLLLPLFLLFDFIVLAQKPENAFLWIEAENFTTATIGFRIVKQSQVTLTEKEQYSEKGWLQKSGRHTEASRKISSGAYVKWEGDNGTTETMQYEFMVPFEDDYYVWVRFNDPPPCNTVYNLWLNDTEDTRKRIDRLRHGIWGVWVWWGWGGEYNNGSPEAFRLNKGKNTLYIGDMGIAGTRFDKILVTNDSTYAPLGISEHFYTGNFSPPAWIGSAHQHSDKMRATATGWIPIPLRRWKVSKELSGNYYYAVSDKPTTETTVAPACSLIRSLVCDVFEASVSMIPQPDSRNQERDALFLFGHCDSSNYNTVRFGEGIVEYLEVRYGVRQIITSVPVASAPDGKARKASIRRDRTGLSVELDGLTVLSTRLAYPEPGGVGVGSFTGGVGFDEVSVLPLDDPKADFDFTQPTDKALRDWILFRGEKILPFDETVSFRKGDILLYKTPSWSNSEVDFHLSKSAKSGFSLLFPYQDLDNMMETRIATRLSEISPKGSFKLIQHIKKQQKSRGSGELLFDLKEPSHLSLQCVKGLFSVFQGGKRIIEANEYDLLDGTIGILFNEDTDTLPIDRIEIRKKDIIVDNFQVSDSGALLPDWQIREGTWKAKPVFESEAADGDAQLLAQGKGTVLIGEDTWKTTLMQISAHFDESTEIALLGWLDGDTAMELYCAKEEIHFRKVIGDHSISLASASVPGFSNGWHRIGFSLGEEGLSAEVDGKERLRLKHKGMKGKSGIRNYGDFAVFDNLTIHVISKQPERQPFIQNVDPLFIDIEKAILK